MFMLSKDSWYGKSSGRYTGPEVPCLQYGSPEMGLYPFTNNTKLKFSLQLLLE